ncbi:MAG: ADP-ribosylglycohydrolase family protein [Clostridia bacterium]|nr:ADP-ribosylglycohydrolase family protein [Clostridia bacterium]
MQKNVSVKLNHGQFRDKVRACWLGKNIGGTIGAPYEGTHDVLDIKGFATEAGAPLPNDDLDLQLVWLHAVEQIGVRDVNCMTLGEFWLSYIPPHWNEYGIGKVNMKRGLLPPLSGDYQNYWKHSNGAWIRTEVWACLFPACPVLASNYSMEDAKVDHGSGEGTYAAAFVAAMQSAAFAIPDLRRCIEIGLARIPSDCRVADSVRFVMDCYDRKLPATDVRNAIQQRNADIGDGWFESPSNVAYAVLGLLYGEGDFKKSMITAVNCGDDTDCTAATVGATFGILNGTAALPTDWCQHIGDEIVTVSLDRGSIGQCFPRSCTELTDRVVAQTPHALFAKHATACLYDGEDQIPEDIYEKMLADCKGNVAHVAPHSMRFDFTVLSADVVLESEPDIAPNGECRVHLTCTNNWEIYDKAQYNLTIRCLVPDGFSVEYEKQTLRMDRYSRTHPTMYPPTAVTSFTIRAGETVAPVNRCILEIIADGRPTPMYIPITLLG